MSLSSISRGAAALEDTEEHCDETDIPKQGVSTTEESQDSDGETDPVAPMGSKKALIGWLILCYSVYYPSLHLLQIGVDWHSFLRPGPPAR
jgi:hypothetical protein